uniref:DUF3327 domain-containing protein n=1 Tax=Heterorhabditis bacteriophora TaxID=37862 RepID=A0A1I7WAW3_HETBA
MPRLNRALRQMPRLEKALKHREEKSPLLWMTIVAEHSIGRVWQEEGERNGVAFRFLNGTDPALLIPLRMTYTTTPSQDFSGQ